MGNLTDDMTRLRGEVDALRNARGALMQGLARGVREMADEVSAMRAGFANTHAAMAKKAKENRGAFVTEMIHTVSSLLTDFSGTRANMARHAKSEREAFVADMKSAVIGLRKNTAEDLAGARRAWRGPTIEEIRSAELKMRK